MLRLLTRFAPGFKPSGMRSEVVIVRAMSSWIHVSPGQRRSIHTAIAKRDWGAKVALGWDVAHTEQTKVTIAQARHGLRPK